MAVKQIALYNIINLKDHRQKSEYTTDNSLDGDPNIKIKIKELQEQLILLLLENQDGMISPLIKSVSLKKIPKLQKERVYFELNLIELGFSKLNNFIDTIKDVIQIENNE
ncbi:unnamed protein product [Paramecium sonneborni]|uniref:HTH OST-type domain-containing protein n=1 Tax=Paramecium sonneborni TaxID=65129 RepID=A0A8S1KVA2_9CILI|nr:unnamed protein product [Paramecium sonneborni]